MSTDFNFGFNIHDFDPDARKGQAVTEPPHWTDNGITIDSLVAEVKSRIRSITQFVREEGTLINYNKPQDGTSRNRSSQSTGIPKLTVQNLTFDKRKARVLATRNYDGKWGMQVGLKIAYAGQTYIWYLNVPDAVGRNPNFDFLINQFGQDENNWVDGEFYLYLENDEFSNQNRIRCAAVEKETPTRKRG